MTKVNSPLPCGPEHANGWSAFDAKGRILRLDTGVVVVPYLQHRGYWEAAILDGNDTYPRGGYNICVFDKDILDADELSATDSTARSPSWARARAHLQRCVDAGIPTVNVRQVLNLLSPTWPGGNYEAAPQDHEGRTHPMNIDQVKAFREQLIKAIERLDGVDRVGVIEGTDHVLGVGFDNGDDVFVEITPA
jgi:hypothetical protein